VSAAVHFEVVTLFPEMIRDALRFGVVSRALARGRVTVGTQDPRQFTTDVHRTVDDRPYGGGPGMVMKVEPLRDAIRSAKASAPPGSRVVYLSAQGRVFDQSIACELRDAKSVVLVCGRYEGVDERLIEAEVDEELSVGDYVLSGGELPALVVIDTVTRLVPGVLGDEQSAVQDSFADGLLDWPHYTRPEEVDGRRVPQELVNGNHATIRRWRLKQSLGRTWRRRPQLLEQLQLSSEQRELLAEFIAEFGEESQKNSGPNGPVSQREPS